jgi:hypothetical protein
LGAAETPESRGKRRVLWTQEGKKHTTGLFSDKKITVH